jgi:hypothetical protein
MAVFAIIAGLTLVFSTMVYDWWKYGRVRQ